MSVFDVVVDRENRQFVDILFDRPLGEGKVDQIIDPVASEYRMDLIPERLLQEGQVFSGEAEVVVRTDQFLVEGIDVVEEPALEGKGKLLNEVFYPLRKVPSLPHVPREIEERLLLDAIL